MKALWYFETLQTVYPATQRLSRPESSGVVPFPWGRNRLLYIDVTVSNGHHMLIILFYCKLAIRWRLPITSFVFRVHEWVEPKLLSPISLHTVAQRQFTLASCTLINAQAYTFSKEFNPLNAELNPICHLLALLGVYFLHFSRIRVKSLTLRLLMSYIYIYIYGAPILDVSRSHTTTHHSR